jgi:putative component of toxin-antitoxin plasmid stabilization module
MPSGEPEDERVRMNGDQWEPCAFSLDGHEFGVLRGGESIPIWIPLAGIDEIRVHHGPDGAISELELHAGNGWRIGARPRRDLVETMLSRGWEAGATISATSDADVQPATPATRRRQNF